MKSNQEHLTQLLQTVSPFKMLAIPLSLDALFWSRGQTEIYGLFCEFVAPPRKKNLVAIFR